MAPGGNPNSCGSVIGTVAKSGFPKVMGGPKEARDLLKSSVAVMADRIWTEKPTTIGAETIFEKTLALSPRNEAQRSLQAQALKMIWS